MKAHASFNRCYRLLWSGATEQWKPVPETARTAKKGGRGKAANALTMASVLPSVAMSLFVMSNLAAQPPPTPPAPPITQLPSGGNVVAGQATISQSAIATAANMVVNQNSQRAIIDWSNFNLGSAATLQFVQPNAQSVILNRVLDPNPSQIFGRINANGQVFITNPYGVYFSPTATVDVGGLVATTYSLRNEDFMSGFYRFQRNGAIGRVVNEGSLRANVGGYIALLAPEVQNSGVVLARAGSVAMASGDQITLTLSDGKSLSGITTTASSVASLIENKLAVEAPDGQIILSAVALNKLQAGVIKNSGSLQATSMTAKGGKIVLEGDEIELTATSVVDVSGRNGGGTVLMGGEWQGSGSLRQATKVSMAQGASIIANATDRGDGGQVVLWSNVSDANSQMQVHGSIQADAGPNGGNGGQIETSGHYLNVDGIQVSTQAPRGVTGQWLLDPANITISTGANADYTNANDTLAANSTCTSSVINNATLSAALATTNVTVTTTNNGTSGLNTTGVITIASNLSWSTDKSLTLVANDGFAGAGNISMTGGGSLVLNNTNVATSTALSGVISGNGSVVKLGTGTLKLSGANTYTGNTTIAGGTAMAMVTTSSPVYDAVSGNYTFTSAAFGKGVIKVLDGGSLNVSSYALYNNLEIAGSGNGSGLGALIGYSVIRSPITLTANATVGFSSIYGNISSVAGQNFGLGIANNSNVSLYGGNTFTGDISVGANSTLKLVTALGAATANVSYFSNISLSATNSNLTLQTASDLYSLTLNGSISGPGNIDVPGSLSTSPMAAGITYLNGVLGITGTVNVYYQSLVVNSPIDYTFTGVTAGSAGGRGLTLAGTHTMTMTRDNYIGSTLYVNNGAGLILGNGGTTGSITGALVNNGTVTINRSNDFNLSSTFSGNGLIVKQGNNTVSLTGANAGDSRYGTVGFLGCISVAQGTLLAATSGSLGANTSIDVANGATLNISTYSPTIGALTGQANGTVLLNSDLKIGIVGCTSSSTYGGMFKGNGSLSKEGLGTLTLSGDNSNFNGNITVINGTLAAASSNALGSVVGKTILSANTTLDIQNTAIGAENLTLNNNSTLMISTGNGSLAGDFSWTGVNQISAPANSTLTLSGNITGTASVNKIGAGSVYLSGANSSYGGTLNVTTGVLAFDSPLAIGKTANLNAGNVLFSSTNASTTDLGNGTAFFHSNTVINNVGLNITTSGAIVGDGNIVINGTLGYLRLLTGTASSLSGNISGAGYLSIGDSTHKSPFTLSGANSFGYLSATNGTIQVGSDSVFDAGGNLTSSALGLGAYRSSFAVLDLNGHNVGNELLVSNGSVVSNAIGTSNVTGMVNISASAEFNVAANARVNLNGKISTGSINGLNKTGLGVLAINTPATPATQTQSFSFNASAGTLLLNSNTSSFKGANNITLGASVLWSGNATSAASTTIENNGFLQFLQPAGFSTNNGFTMTGTGTLRFSNAGNVTWNSQTQYNSVYTGTVLIDAGTNVILPVGSIFSTRSNSVVNNGTLTLSPDGNPGAITRYNNNQISGSGNLYIADSSGTGYLSISGLNSYTGSTTIASANASVFVLNNLGSGNITNNGKLYFNPVNNTAATWANNITGTGGLWVGSTNTSLTLTGNVNQLTLGFNSTGTTTGGRLIMGAQSQLGVNGTFAGDLSLGGASVNSFEYASANDVNLTGNITGPGSFTKNGSSNVTISGVNTTYSGGTFINGGTLYVGTGGTTGSLGAGNVTTNASLVINRSGAIALSTLVTCTSATLRGTGNVTVQSTNSSVTIDRNITLTGDTSVIKLIAGSSLAAGNVSGNVTLTNNISTGANGTLVVFGGSPVTNSTATLMSKTTGANSSAVNYKTYNATASILSNAVAGARNFFYRVQPSANLTGGTVIATKVYDGTTTANATYTPTGTPPTGTIDGDTLTGSVTGATYNTSFAGTKSLNLSLSLVSANASWVVSGYSGSVLNATTTANITQAPLIIQANDDARFVTFSDASGYAGVSYSGLVNNETPATAGFTGTLAIARSNSGNNAAGTYTLTPSGLLANNYRITYRTGTYTIVPAQQLIVRVTDGTSIYGNVTSLAVASATYLMPDNVTIVNLTNNLNVSGAGLYTLQDGASGSASFNLGLTNATMSGSNHATVGVWNVGYSNLNKVGVNFNNMTVVGTQTITQRTINVTAVVSDKVYDGNTSATLVSLSNNSLANDVIAVTANTSALFADKNAGDGKIVTLNNVTLSGTDAGNYLLVSNVATTTANITPKSITLNGLTANDKVYDATTNASIDFTGVSGLLGIDNVQVSTSSLVSSFANKNVGTNKNINITGLALSGLDAGNYKLETSNITANITPKALTVSGLSVAATKVYDGTNVAAPLGAASLLTLSAPGAGTSADGKAYNSDVVAITGMPTATYNSKDVATAVNVSFGGISLTGAGASNYVLTPPSAVAATITPAALFMQANDDAKFVTLGDVAGYAGVSYRGFVNGETSATAGLAGTLSIVRSNNTSNAAGTYTLTPSGISASNYNITALTGTYTIVPAESLLIRVGNASTVYGSATNLNVTNASYLMADNVTIVDLTSNVTSNGAGLYTVQDGVSGSATFKLGLTNATLSQSGNVAAGIWHVGFSNFTQGGANFNNISAVGTETVTAKAITISATGTNKVYDGTANATVTLSSTDTISGDNISYVYGNASFNNKNVDTGKAVSVANLTLGGADANNYIVQNLVTSTTADITPKALTISGITGVNKVYDGTLNATGSNAALSMVGLVAGDSVIVTATGTFADKNVGTSKLVTLTSTYTGTDAGNYNITSQANTTASITPKDLNISGITAETKVYDGNLSATVNTSGVNSTSLVTMGMVAGDSLSVAATGLFTNKNVGSSKVVTLNSTYSGTDVGNYNITSQVNTTASITPKALTITGITGDNKVYDGNLSAVVNTTGVNSSTLVGMGMIAGDNLSVSATGLFANKNVGTSKAITINSTYSGADAANYNITSQANTTANITARALTITGITVANKTYDGNTNATVNTSAVNSTSLVGMGLIAGDNLSVSATGLFADKNVNAAKVVTLNSTFSGTDAANYNITSQTTATAAITPKALSISGITADNKVYDATSNASVNTSAITSATLTSAGLITGDNLTLSVTGTFADKNVGTAKLVTLNSTYSGTDASNYNITLQANTTASIAPKALTVSGLSAATTKVYDGTNVASPIGAATLLSLSAPGTGTSTDGKAYSGDVVSVSGSPTATYNSKDVATAANISLGGIALTGAGANNYVLTLPTPIAATITPAPLVIRANDDARFVTLSDAAGYAGASYNGFVNNENVSTAGFSGALNIVRSNNTSGAAGSYTLTASGLSSSNYNVTYQTGTYTIAPAQSLLIRVSSGSSVYGSAANLTVTNASYLMSDNVTIVNLTNNLTVNGAGLYTLQDGLSGTASFNLGLSNATLSQSGHASVGIWGVGFSNFTQGGANFNSISAVGTQTVTAKAMTVAASGVNKTYDGTSNATVTLSSTDAISGDNVSYAYSNAIFSDKNVGTGKAVSTANFTLSGSDANNYLIQNLVANTTANITPKSLNITGITASNKVYDGNTTASVNTAAVNNTSLIGMGLIAGDDFSLTATGVFADKNVASTKVVTLNSTYGGADAGNYNITSQATTTAAITPKSLTISGITAANKVYDATTNATIDTSAITNVTLVNAGMIAGDSLTVNATGTFADKNVNTGKLVTLNSSYSGADAGNYNITSQANTTADITPKALTLSGLSVAASKVYDGTNVAAPLGVATLLALSDPGAGSSTDGKAYSGDVVSVSGTPIATYNSKDVATAANVSLSGITLTGAAAGNYVLTTPSPIAATITPAPLVVRANDDARFVTLNDTAGYAGVSYNGFVNNENSATAGLAGTLNIVRSNNSSGAAGSYTLSASGLTSSNYNLSYQAGTYTIVPAESLLIRVGTINTVYGNAPTLTVTQASYLMANNATIVDLSSNVTSNGAGLYTVQDGVSGSATFKLGLNNAAMSQSGNVAAGIWSVGFSNFTQGGANFNNISAVGTQTVTAKPITITATGVNKVYDGTSNATVALNSADAISGDNISYAYSNAIFGNKNVDTNKGVSAANFSLSGSDANNYIVQNLVANTTANITPKALTISGITAANKVYDGTTSAVVSTAGVTNATLVAAGMIAGDDLNISASGVFSDPNVGTGKTVSLTSTYSGADVRNYSFTSQLTALADITGNAGGGSSRFDNEEMTSQRALALITQTTRSRLIFQEPGSRPLPSPTASSRAAPRFVESAPPTDPRVGSSGAVPITVIENNKVANLGMVYEQLPDDIHIQLTTSTLAPQSPSSIRRFSAQFKTFMVRNERNELINYQGALVGKRIVILAKTGNARRFVRVGMENVLAAAIQSLGGNKPIALSEIEVVVVDLR